MQSYAYLIVADPSDMMSGTASIVRVKGTGEDVSALKRFEVGLEHISLALNTRLSSSLT
jgi:hypothetical protein